MTTSYKIERLKKAGYDITRLGKKINAYNKKYRKENKEKIDKRRKEYIQEKRKSERKFNNL